MPSKGKELCANIDRLEKKLCAARKELKNYQETCQHKWDQSKEEVSLININCISGFPPQKKKFSRTCLECRKTEYTEAFEAEYHPIFGPQEVIEQCF